LHLRRARVPPAGAKMPITRVRRPMSKGQDGQQDVPRTRRPKMNKMANTNAQILPPIAPPCRGLDAHAAPQGLAYGAP